MPEVDFSALEEDFDNIAVGEEEEPKRTRKPRSDKGTSRKPRQTTAKKLANDLLSPWAKLAQTLAFGAPTVSAVMLSRGEKTVDALVGIAQEYPRMYDALKKVSKVGPATELAETIAHVGIAVALDTGNMPADHPVAMLTGVSDLYHQVHPPEDQDTPDQHMNGSMVPPPPFFSVVS